MTAMLVDDTNVRYTGVLSLAERDRRYAAIRAAMAADGIGTLVVAARDATFGKGNLRYVTSYGIVGGDLYCVFPLKGEPGMVVAPGYQKKAQRLSWVSDVVETKVNGYTQWGDMVRQAVLKLLHARDNGDKVGIVGMDEISVPLYLGLRLEFGDRVVDATAAFKRVRAVKSDEELRMMEKSAEVAVRACLAAKEKARPGVSDFELYAALKRVIHENGCEYSADFIDGNGVELQLTPPVGETLRDGGNFTAEVSPAYAGYCAQLATTFSVGKPTARTEAMNKVWQEAMALGVPAIRPGNTGGDVYRALAPALKDRGYLSPFRAGHGVGLEINDAPPAIVPSDTTVLVPGMTFVFHLNLVDPETKEGIMYGGTYAVTDTGARELYTPPDGALWPSPSKSR
jgi:Xaa-Pro aminopeptidase